MRQFLTQHRRWLMRGLKLLVVVLLIWGVRGTLLSARDKLAEEGLQQLIDWRPAWLCAAGVLYLLSMLPCGAFWHRLLRTVGQQSSLARTLRAYYVGHLGKYVPGKAMVIIIRAGLLPRQATLTAVTATIFLETLTSMAVAATLGVIVLAVVGAAGNPHQRWWLLAGILLAAGAIAPTLPPVFRQIARLLRIDRGNPAEIERLAGLGYAALSAGWLGIALGWVVTGLSLWATVRGLGHDGGEFWKMLPIYAAATALATVAGFVSFLPGGAVVREIALTELLVVSGGLDQSLALVAALAWRIVGLVAELVISVILYLAGHRSP